MDDTILEPLPAMCVTATEGVQGIQQAWEDLESKLPSLKGRKFYGVFQHPDGPYRACVVLRPGESAEEMGLEPWTIPGGRYARRRLNDWEEHTDEIGRLFEEMANTRDADAGRPSLEFYRSQRELILMLPVRE